MTTRVSTSVERGRASKIVRHLIRGVCRGTSRAVRCLVRGACQGASRAARRLVRGVC